MCKFTILGDPCGHSVSTLCPLLSLGPHFDYEFTVLGEQGLVLELTWAVLEPTWAVLEPTGACLTANMGCLRARCYIRWPTWAVDVIVDITSDAT